MDSDLNPQQHFADLLNEWSGRNLSYDDWMELKVLNLSNAGINRDIPVQTLPELRFIDLSNNPITNLDLSNFEKLEVLHLTNLPNYHVLLQSISLPPNLKKLDLSNNKIYDLLDSEIQNLTNVKEINLSNNNLTELRDEFGQLKKLEGLNLNDNQFTELPECIENLKNLKRLSFNNNQVYELPDWIENLKKLEVLSFNNNKVTELPEWIDDLKNLKQLSFNNNKVTEFPVWIENLKKLEVLSFNNNKVFELPEWIKNLKKLEVLSFNNNPIDYIDPEIGNLPKLKRVNAKGTKITSRPKEFKRLNKKINFKFDKYAVLEKVDKEKRKKSIYKVGKIPREIDKDQPQINILEITEPLPEYYEFNKPETTKRYIPMPDFRLITELDDSPEDIPTLEKPKKLLFGPDVKVVTEEFVQVRPIYEEYYEQQLYKLPTEKDETKQKPKTVLVLKAPTEYRKPSDLLDIDISEDSLLTSKIRKSIQNRLYDTLVKDVPPAQRQRQMLNKVREITNKIEKSIYEQNKNSFRDYIRPISSMLHLLNPESEFGRIAKQFRIRLASNFYNLNNMNQLTFNDILPEIFTSKLLTDIEKDELKKLYDQYRIQTKQQLLMDLLQVINPGLRLDSRYRSSSRRLKKLDQYVDVSQLSITQNTCDFGIIEKPEDVVFFKDDDKVLCFNKDDILEQLKSDEPFNWIAMEPFPQEFVDRMRRVLSDELEPTIIVNEMEQVVPSPEPPVQSPVQSPPVPSQVSPPVPSQVSPPFPSQVSPIMRRTPSTPSPVLNPTQSFSDDSDSSIDIYESE